MLDINLQFFGGRGSSGAGGSGGGGGAKKASNAKGSASNPVSGGQLTNMSESERVTALNAMPAGTIVSKRATGGDTPIRYQKDASGQWHMEIKYNTIKRGKPVQTKEWMVSSDSSAQLAKFGYSNSSFSSVKYPKK